MRLLLCVGLFCCISQVSAQSTKEETLANLNQTAGIYYCYHNITHPCTPAPKGYRPFYISHYGRHGSRWHASKDIYQNPYQVLTQAHNAGALTPCGEKLYQQMIIIYEDAKDRYGDLSPRGVAEHRAIAERMYSSYPEVFSTKRGHRCNIECRSTLVPRCILSMAAATERLKELNPRINVLRESSSRYLPFMSNKTQTHKIAEEIKPRIARLCDSLYAPQRLMQTLFCDQAYVDANIPNPNTLMNSLYYVASIMQDVGYLGISIYNIFTPEELYTIWKIRNYQIYLECGPSEEFGQRALSAAKPLLQNIIDEADRAITNGDIAACLRYGHDIYVIPLVALMGVENTCNRESDFNKVNLVWSNYIVSPMAVNIQLIFFSKSGSGDILVKILFNEKESLLVGLQSDIAPYYHWSQLRAHLAALAK